MARVKAERQVDMIKFSLLAILVGIVTGLGALLFRILISFIHNLFFVGEFSFHYDANELVGASPLGIWIILAPVIGGLGVVYLVKKFAPEAKGHGVPEVMYAVYYKEGIMRPMVALIKSVASALSIGSGASVGREGPIIQIGSSLGSTIGQFFKVEPWQRVTLLAAGAGAGIAATFNTPLGGVMFAIEMMLLEVSARTFLPIVLATGVATYVGRIFFGLQPAFIVPTASIPSVVPMGIAKIGSFMVLGVFCGLASFLFIRLLSFMEKGFFGKMQVNDYVKNIIGMSFVGVLIYILSLYYGHYYIDGVGYGTIQGILQGNISAFGFLILLFILKLLATTVSLGAGASGGIFSPSLFIGACLGGAFGNIVNVLWPDMSLGVIESATVGMAAVVGGATGAAVTAIIMIFEMTRDYNIIVPMVMAVAISIGTRRVLSKENIYTIKLLWRGLRIPERRYINMFLVRHARDVMEKAIVVAPFDARFASVVKYVKGKKQVSHILIEKHGLIIGSVSVDRVVRNTANKALKNTMLKDVMDINYIIVREDDIFHQIMERLRHGRGEIALVLADGQKEVVQDNIKGIISKDRILDSILRYFK